jgi:tetratricopeptide (TPR) repeat protein
MALGRLKHRSKPDRAAAPSTLGTDPYLQELARTWRYWLPRCALIAALVAWIYAPSLNGGWIWDDNLIILRNPLLSESNGWWKIWTEPGRQFEYYPLTSTVQWVEWQYWANQTLGYHVVNVALHFANALLVWRLLGKFGLKLAWIGGLLFAVHPVQVESVAWIVELKNTLSLFLLLLAMGLYLDFEQKREPRAYGRALVFFALALFAKLSVVLLPIVILLHAWWRRGRIVWDDIKTSAPFFAVALVVGLITIVGGEWSKQFGNLPPDYLPAGGALGRLVLVGQEGAFYFSKVFLPVGLLPVYPMWPVRVASPGSYLPWLALVIALGWLWAKRNDWGRHALLGLGFFLVNLAPCPGFIPSPNMGYAWVMDHFLYLPIIGLIGLVVAAMEHLSRQTPAFVYPLGLATFVITLAMAWESQGYAKSFLDEQTFWARTLQQNPEAWVAYEDLSSINLKQGRLDEALAQCQRLLALKPQLSDGHYNMGSILDKMGQPDASLAEYRRAAQLSPADSEIYVNEGGLLLKMGRTDEAVAAYEQAKNLLPNSPELQYNIGSLWLTSGHVAQAIEPLQRAVQLDPDLAPAHENLGSALAQTGHLPEAAKEFAAAVEINPGYVIARSNLALALAQTGHIQEAIDQFQQVLALDPQNALAQSSLTKLQLFQQQHPAVH